MRYKTHIIFHFRTRTDDGAIGFLISSPELAIEAAHNKLVTAAEHGRYNLNLIASECDLLSLPPHSSLVLVLSNHLFVEIHFLLARKSENILWTDWGPAPEL